MKIYIYILILTIISSLSLNAQEYCATEMPAHMEQWLTDYKAMYPGTVSSKFGKRSVEYIPVKVHIVGNDDGNGYYKTSELLNDFCGLNEQYLSVGFHFYIYQEINYIDNTELYDHDNSWAIRNYIYDNNDDNAANLYYVLDPAGACGYFSGVNGGYIAIKKSCAGTDNTTIAHEFGHFFSLPHTFSGWENRDPYVDAPTSWDERVNGTNCSTRGDRFCDTPADYISDRWNCPSNFVKVDYVGDTFAQDKTLYMSYSLDQCQDKFSTEQTDVMQSNLAGPRSNLLVPPPPLIAPINPVQLIDPLQGQTGVDANYTLLKWNKDTYATHYHLQVTRFINPNLLSYDLITTDTLYLLTDLLPNTTYRWRVKAFNAANTCAPQDNYTEYVTTYLTARNTSANITNTSCADSYDGIIGVNVFGGNDDYNFIWSNGATTDSIYGLSAGAYTVTITGGVDTLVQIFEVIPGQINVSFEYEDNNITATALGGSAPHTYEWSNGTTGQTIEGDVGTGYSLTVTDANGCASVRESWPVGVQSTVVNGFDVTLYPNPVVNNGSINLDITSAVNEKAQITLFSYSGKQVKTEVLELTKGLYTETINLSGLATGVYLLNIQTGNKSVTKRLLIL